ncbi:MAG: hypothetical protein MJY62_05030 [Bacteroidales bacterium]|nr:hypothetical protein [Bacteroidales bacterium]
MEEQKKRAVVSYDNMNAELKAAFEAKYPGGLRDYLSDVRKIDKPDGTSIFVVTVEIPSAIYLVKVNIKVDDQEEVGKWLEGDDSDDEGDEDGSGTLPDDNINQYSNGGDEDAPDGE